MKRKSISGAIALLIVALIISFVTPTAFVSAADENSKIAGYEYTAEYLLEEFGYTAEADKDLFDDLTVKYRLTSKRDKDGSREAVAELDAETDKEAISKTPWKSECVSKELTKKTDKVVFYAYGTYTFEIKKGDATENKTVEVYNYADEGLSGKVEIKYDAAKIAAFQTAVTNAVSGKKAGDSDDDNGRIDLSEIECEGKTGINSIVTSKLLAYEDLTSTIYYCAPGSESFSSTSNDYIKLDKVGTHAFYVTYSVPTVDGTLDTTDLVVGDLAGYGWYAKDDDGNPTGSLIIPIFTFEITEADNPVIAVNDARRGYLNLEYTKVDTLFTITASSYKAKYTLYYLDAKDALVKNEDETADAFVERLVKAGAKDITENFENFETGSTDFTPDKKGYYYVEIYLKDDNNNPAHSVSKAIDVTNEFRTVKKETEFFKNNIVSIVLFSISALCFIAIIVILCIKPKEVKLETKSEQTKKNK